MSLPQEEALRLLLPQLYPPLMAHKGPADATATAAAFPAAHRHNADRIPAPSCLQRPGSILHRGLLLDVGERLPLGCAHHGLPQPGRVPLDPPQAAGALARRFCLRCPSDSLDVGDNQTPAERPEMALHAEVERQYLSACIYGRVEAATQRLIPEMTSHCCSFEIWRKLLVGLHGLQPASLSGATSEVTPGGTTVELKNKCIITSHIHACHASSWRNRGESLSN